ncbi:MAG: tRNA pseudouridine(55) synthase TruB, partial [Sulfuricella sp.]|nr:tRNA pseudouridine(55) synthase TruB [Sulfuricella sp.]
MQFKRIKRPISGVLLLDKPYGISSNGALQQAKRLYQAAKAGHTGNLDPIATGLLPICFGEATKFSQFLLDAGKTYQAVFKLGKTTTTGDSEGEVTSSSDVDLSLGQVEQALQQFIGPIFQVPPMHSALKFQGKALYTYARAGVEIERAARPVTIYSLTLDSFAGDELSVTVACSKGTY